jgi:hypothetical protein
MTGTEERFRHRLGQPCDICDGRGFDYLGRPCRRLIDETRSSGWSMTDAERQRFADEMNDGSAMIDARIDRLEAEADE